MKKWSALLGTTLDDDDDDSVPNNYPFTANKYFGNEIFDCKLNEGIIFRNVITASGSQFFLSTGLQQFISSNGSTAASFALVLKRNKSVYDTLDSNIAVGKYTFWIKI